MTMMIIIYLQLQPRRSDNLVLFRYFLFQTVARMCLVAFFLGIFTIEFVLVILIIKLILPPFHVWLIIRIKWGNKWTFFWVMLLMKIPTIILFIILANYYFLEYNKFALIVFFRAALSLFLLWKRGRFTYFLISSSFVHTVWSILGLIVSKSIFFCYYSLYSFVLITIIYSMYGNFEYLLSNEWNWDIYFSLFIFSGVPPSFIFLIKWSLLFRLLDLSFMLFLVALIMTGVSLYLYFRIIFTIMLRRVETIQTFKKRKVGNLLLVNLIGLVLWVVVLQLSSKFKYY